MQRLDSSAVYENSELSHIFHVMQRNGIPILDIAWTVNIFSNCMGSTMTLITAFHL